MHGVVSGVMIRHLTGCEAFHFLNNVIMLRLLPQRGWFDNAAGLPIVTCGTSLASLDNVWSLASHTPLERVTNIHPVQTYTF